ncbi:hypothetical protein FQA39_LY11252 [Lamprigera yunnana]|nr:hypothetical protein FQA39_LY11252 [Lamprigera yunnana]
MDTYGYCSQGKRNLDNGTGIHNTYTQVSQSDIEKVSQMADITNDYNFCTTVNKYSDNVDEILEKFLIAYEYMTPAIEEIINLVSNYTHIYEIEDSICSITVQQYEEVIKAIMLIKEVSDLKKMSVFQTDKLLNDIKHSIKVGSTTTTSTFRVHLKKTAVNDLIQLYKMLYEEIQELNYTTDVESEFASVISQKLQENMAGSPDELAIMEAEYQALSDTIAILKSVINETTGSSFEIKDTSTVIAKVPKNMRSSKSFASLKTNKCTTDAYGARRCILECLYELTEVGKQLKSSKRHQTDNCDNQKNISHFHAKLNGIPMMLKLNKVL